MGCLKPLKLKELFMWCAVMGAFGVQLWGLLVCSYGNPGLRPEKPREFFIWCTDMGNRSRDPKGESPSVMVYRYGAFRCTVMG
jgi:hypothetical protein